MTAKTAVLRHPVAGYFALMCALVAILGLSLAPSLGYLPAVVAAAMFTLVTWSASCVSFSRVRTLVGLGAVLAVGSASAVLFWLQVPGWFLIPALCSAVATVVTRTPVWAATTCLAATYGAWFLI